MLCEKQFFLQSAEIRLPVLNIIKDYVNNNNKVTRKMAIPQDKVFDIINLVLTSTLYTFNSQFYQQIDGVAMRRPPSSTRAKIYM